MIHVPLVPDPVTATETVCGDAPVPMFEVSFEKMGEEAVPVSVKQTATHFDDALRVALQAGLDGAAM
jgi:hypothetical protein